MDKKSEQKVVVVDSYIERITQTINNFFVATDEERSAQKNRRSMIKLIRKIWVDGVLNHSIHGAALIELGLNVNNDAVTRPWDLLLGEGQKNLFPIPHGKKVIDIFDENNQSLLILGEPGSGKTTLILEIVRDELLRAESDHLCSIPVLFNLSSWESKTVNFEQWLVHELVKVYLIPEKIATKWVDNDELILFLDGLDEISELHRKSCVEAINKFRSRHGLCSIAVSSRSFEYKLLCEKLNLNAAIVILPLTSEQVTNYLKGERQELVTVRNAIKDDVILSDLAQSPLILDIMILAFQETSVEAVRSLRSIEQIRKFIFKSYIDWMFKRRIRQWGFTKEKTVTYLKWLANILSGEGKNYFFVEDLGPNSLKNNLQRGIYAISTFLCVCLFSTIITGFLGSIHPNVGWGLVTPGLFMTIFLGGTIIYASKDEIPSLHLYWSFGWRGWLIGSIKGLKWGFILSFLWFMFFFVILAPCEFISSAFDLGNITEKFFNTLRIISFFSVIGFFVGGISKGITIDEVSSTLKPAQHLWGTVKQFVLILSGIILVNLFFVKILYPYAGIVVDFIFYFEGWIAVPLLGILFFKEIITHFILRFFLLLNGYFPWRMVYFLEYARDRIYLYRIGGGYSFIHRLLSDYIKNEM